MEKKFNFRVIFIQGKEKTLAYIPAIDVMTEGELK